MAQVESHCWNPQYSLMCATQRDSIREIREAMNSRWDVEEPVVVSKEQMIFTLKPSI